MREIKYTTRFQRDDNREMRLPRRNLDHQLSGDHQRDCPIRPDLVLIYRKPDHDSLERVRPASHSELGLGARHKGGDSGNATCTAGSQHLRVIRVHRRSSAAKCAFVPVQREYENPILAADERR